jgi:hypothetical protein
MGVLQPEEAQPEPVNTALPFELVVRSSTSRPDLGAGVAP